MRVLTKVAGAVLILGAASINPLPAHAVKIELDCVDKTEYYDAIKEIKRLGAQIEEMRPKVDKYSSSSVDEFNTLIRRRRAVKESPANSYTRGLYSIEIDVTDTSAALIDFCERVAKQIDIPPDCGKQTEISLNSESLTDPREPKDTPVSVFTKACQKAYGNKFSGKVTLP